MRVQSRAIQRCGELVDEVEPARGNNQYSGDGRGDPTKLGRFAVAKEAGLSRDKTVTALRVARVPKDQFEQLVKPPIPTASPGRSTNTAAMPPKASARWRLPSGRTCRSASKRQMPQVRYLKPMLPNNSV
jgi:hypothetical protein